MKFYKSKLTRDITTTLKHAYLVREKLEDTILNINGTNILWEAGKDFLKWGNKEDSLKDVSLQIQA